MVVEYLEVCMCVGYLFKGVVCIVGLEIVVKVVYVLEDCFVLVQQGKLWLEKKYIDVLLCGVDLLGWIVLLLDGDEIWVDYVGSFEVQVFL